ncbi:MAG: endonuclease/exonuclease/phosphatase family metal-dependent hydrolase [Gammaproteobacteria bacterium]|jgi:endonuclease/exonuclease/phosphatase family metal-dependent hydrolase
MKLATYNIQFGRGKDEINDLERIAREVSGADIICLQEVDRNWSRSNNVDQVEVFKQLFPDYHAEYGPGVNLIADIRDSSGHVMHQRRQFGNMTLSKFPIRYCRHHLLPKHASTGPISIQRSALECTIEAEESFLRLTNTHLTHLSGETRAPQIQYLLDIHQSAQLEGEPVCGDLEPTYWKLDTALPRPPRNAIVVGDFNFEPGSDNYTAMTGPMSDYGGRIINPDLLMDAWVASGHDEADGFSSDVDGRPTRLDHIFVNPDLGDFVTKCWIDEQAQGSDHQPMWMEFSLPG